MNNIDYNHAYNVHVLDGPKTIFPLLQERYECSSVLDVGCGIGTWLKAATDCGVKDFLGIDGADIADDLFLVSKRKFRKQDLRDAWEINRKFDLVICLEVAEHLPKEAERNLIASIVKHSNLVVFSAACPYQGGQGHINCHWPMYWQELFNDYGFSCLDQLRPLLWEEKFPEYWYKQNIFVAKKDPNGAGLEPRLMSIVHPDLYIALQEKRNSYNALLSGNENIETYASLLLMKLKKTLKDKLRAQ